MAVVRNLMVRIGADLSSLKQGMAQANKEITKFGSSINSVTSGIGLAIGGSSLTAFFTESAKAAMDVQSSIMSLSRTMGASVNDFNDWAKNSAEAFNMSTRDAFVYGKTFSILLSGISKDGQDNMQMTTKLLEASALLANRHGKSMQETMERIRSGILGETDAIEDLGIFVNLSMLKSTDAFKRFAGNRSWDDLDFQTQQLIRYFAILEQTSNTFGTNLDNSTTSSIQRLSASIDNLKLNIGEGFIPILDNLIPPLIEAAKYFKEIQDAAYQFGYSMAGGEGYAKKFSDSVIQVNKTIQQQNKPLQQTNSNLDKTIKNMKTLAGFDEINLLGTSKDNTSKNAKSASQTTKDAKTKTTDTKNQPNKLEVSTKTKNNKGVSPFVQFGKDVANYLNSNEKSPFGQFVSDFGNMLMQPSPPLQQVVDEQIKLFADGLKSIPPLGIVNDIQKAMGSEKYYTKEMQNAKPSPAPAPKTSAPTPTPNPVKKAVTPMKVNPNMSTTYGAKQEPFVKPKTTAPLKTTTTTKTTTVTSGPPAGSFMSTPKPAKPKTKLATGGIIDSPTTALIGEAGKELVMPLENTSFTDKVASALGTAVMGAMQMGNNMTGNNGKEIVLKIDGNTIARAINPYLTKESARVGNAIISIS